MRTRRATIAAALVAALSSARAASAGEPASAAQRAEQTFNEGVALATAGKYAEACPKFEESQAIDPALGTEFNLANCYEHTGRPAAAWTMFLDVAKRAEASGKTERQQIARARAAALEARVPRLRIVLAHPDPSVQVWRDGAAVRTEALGEAVPLEVGEHTVDANVPGKKAWHSKVVVQEGRTVEVHVPDLTPLEPATAAPVSTSTPPSTTPSTPPPADASTEGTSPLRIVGLGVAGLGVVGVGLGAFFGLRASSKNDDSNAPGHCDPSGCDAQGRRDCNDALAAARHANIAFVAGGVLVAGGAVLFFIAKPTKPATQTTAQRTLVVAPGVGSLSVHGTW